MLCNIVYCFSCKKRQDHVFSALKKKGTVLQDIVTQRFFFLSTNMCVFATKNVSFSPILKNKTSVVIIHLL